MSTANLRSGNRVPYLSLGYYEGRSTWHYLLVDRLKLPLLEKEAKSGAVDLMQYGQIIFSGFGDSPPDEVTCFVRKRYGNG